MVTRGKVKKRRKISFTKKELIQILSDHLDTVYEVCPPKSIFEDMHQYIPDFAEGYFKGFFRPERLNDSTFLNDDDDE